MNVFKCNSGIRNLSRKIHFQRITVFFKILVVALDFVELRAGLLNWNSLYKRDTVFESKMMIP